MPLLEKNQALLRETRWRWSHCLIESNLTAMRCRWRISSKTSIDITNQSPRSRFIKWRETLVERAPTEEKRPICHEPTDTEVALRGAVA